MDGNLYHSKTMYKYALHISIKNSITLKINYNWYTVCARVCMVNFSIEINDDDDGVDGGGSSSVCNTRFMLKATCGKNDMAYALY